MTEDGKDFEVLRARATEVLSHKENQPRSGVAGFTEETLALMEELEIYKVELELQNQELQLSETNLMHANKRLQTLLNSLPLSILVVDQSGVVIESNERAAQMFNLRSTSLIENHSILRLVDVSDRELVYSSIRDLNDDAAAQIGPISVGNSPAELVDFHLVRLPSSYHLDRRILVAAIERTRHYQDLGRVMMLENLVDAAELSIIAFNRSHRCLFANRSALQSIGLASEEVIGKRRAHWMSEAEAHALEREDYMVLETKQSYMFERKSADPNRPDSVQVTHKFPLVEEDGHLSGVGAITTEVIRASELPAD